MLIRFKMVHSMLIISCEFVIWTNCNGSKITDFLQASRRDHCDIARQKNIGHGTWKGRVTFCCFELPILETKEARVVLVLMMKVDEITKHQRGYLEGTESLRSRPQDCCTLSM